MRVSSRMGLGAVGIFYRAEPVPNQLSRLGWEKVVTIPFFPWQRPISWHKTRCEIAVRSLSPKILIGAAVLAAIVSSTNANIFPAAGPTVPGTRARLSGGKAAAPESAPISVKRAIWAANQLFRKPYVFGGGHKSFVDRGYDCSGTVSYALGAAGLLKSPISSSEFRKYGEGGHGTWSTIDECYGPTHAIIAGLRLDTTPFLTAHDKWAPGWQLAERAPGSGFEARHPVGL